MTEATKKIFLKSCILFICIFFANSIKAQKILPYVITEKGDTIYLSELHEIKVNPKKRSGWNARRYSRLVRKIKKVYPFAISASREMEIYSKKFEGIDDPKAQKAYIKSIEKKLFEQYGETLRSFTISEGRYLMLLIDRETGETSYKLIKELKGGFSATMWQGVARIFRNNLKEEYDPDGAHYQLERIILLIEAGKL